MLADHRTLRLSTGGNCGAGQACNDARGTLYATARPLFNRELGEMQVCRNCLVAPVHSLDLVIWMPMICMNLSACDASQISVPFASLLKWVCFDSAVSSNVVREYVTENESRHYGWRNQMSVFLQEKNNGIP